LFKRRHTLSKRKTGALRKEQSSKKMQKVTTYYGTESNNTIDFNQVHKVKKPVELVPQSINQEHYILNLMDNSKDIVVVYGPAGTGKTYLGMLAALKALRQGDCKKIILTRPAVAVDDEKHGFLPGDLNDKMEPWVRPLLDILKEYYSMKEVEYMLKEQIVEITPLAFCRGRNFKNSWVILDEAQNATPSQIKMLMTRIGVGSKIVITGDVEQTDRRTKDNGLLDLTYRLAEHPVSEIGLSQFEVRDIRRHRIIEKVLRLYD